jgi:hypothetical protein
LVPRIGHEPADAPHGQVAAEILFALNVQMLGARRTSERRADEETNTHDHRLA